MQRFVMTAAAVAVAAGTWMAGFALDSTEGEPARPLEAISAELPGAAHADGGLGSPGGLSGNVVVGTGPASPCGFLDAGATASAQYGLSITGATADQLAFFSHESTATTAGPWTYHDAILCDPPTQRFNYVAYFELPDGMTAHDLSAQMTIDAGTSDTQSVSADDLGPYVVLQWKLTPDRVGQYDIKFNLTADGQQISDVLTVWMPHTGEYQVSGRATQFSPAS